MWENSVNYCFFCTYKRNSLKNFYFFHFDLVFGHLKHCAVKGHCVGNHLKTIIVYAVYDLVEYMYFYGFKISINIHSNIL